MTKSIKFWSFYVRFCVEKTDIFRQIYPQKIWFFLVFFKNLKKSAYLAIKTSIFIKYDMSKCKIQSLSSKICDHFEIFQLILGPFFEFWNYPEIQVQILYLKYNLKEWK